MSLPKIVLRDGQTSLADCLKVIEADATIAADNADAEGEDPGPVALAHVKRALHSVADSLVIEGAASGEREAWRGEAPTKKKVTAKDKTAENGKRKKK